jgi:hypothetical protein
MRIPGRRATVLTLATGAAIAVTAGTASAYWQASATGQGAARSANPGWLSIDPGTPTTALVPGATADVTVVIGNPTATPVLVTSVATPVGGIPGYGDPRLLYEVPGCSAASSGVYALKSGPRATSFVIAPHGSYTVILKDAVEMSDNSAAACQGVLFAVPVTVQAAIVVGAAASVPAASTL